MLDFVIGSRKRPVIDILVEALRKIEAEGITYVGYPVVMTDTEPITVDALLTSKELGVWIFDVLEKDPGEGGWEEIEEHQSQLVAALTSRLLVHKDLRKGRSLAFEISVATFYTHQPNLPESTGLQVFSPQQLAEGLVDRAQPLEANLLTPLNAALQSVSTIKPRKKRSLVQSTHSRGAVLKEIEKHIANLDHWQRLAAVETPEGPQRIRGIAGSGKTVVLALKAAYLHAQNPDWTIVVTFQTQSLYSQFRDLINRFYLDYAKEEPDWSKLKVLHAWGSSRQPGVYSEIALSIRAQSLSFSTAMARYGRERAFEGACDELLTTISKNSIEPSFDAILIDEAQDLPTSFFRVMYQAAKSPKRVVWAYDELQNLSSYSVAPPDELFGSNSDGKPLVELHNEAGEPHQDVILPVCYRNTQWALATAHALGFGVYRANGLCQFFDDPALWNDIGYEVVDGSLSSGKDVSLARKKSCSPKFFADLLKYQDAVQCKRFGSVQEQCAWVVESIKNNLTEDELEPDDILIIFPNPLTAASDAGPLISLLRSQHISSHLAGVTSSRDELFIPRSVAISGIRRAKGNEAPMVYVLNSEHCLGGPELIRKRNILFTSITRSRAWLRLCGCGPLMDNLQSEFEAVVSHSFRLDFTVPTIEELENLRKIHREMTSDERRLVSGAGDVLSELLDKIEAGELSAEHVPESLRVRLRTLLDPDSSSEK